jgi:hypothetical protein
VTLAIGAGGLALAVLTPGVAVGKQSPPKPHPSERIEVCHEGKTIKVYPGELIEHLLHGDLIVPCPPG